MHYCRNNGSPQHCVLPFEAKPRGVADLRRVITLQLAVWGLPDLAERAMLAVTELAANVIKHVGDGTPATVELEARDGYLRLEMHDTSPALPVLQHATAEEESGRGLALIAALAEDWGWARTPTGKTIWCDLAPDSTGAMLLATRSRILRAGAVIETYGRQSDESAAFLTGSIPVMEETVTDLIADLLHWLAAHGSDPDTILDHAQMHFEAEADQL